MQGFAATCCTVLDTPTILEEWRRTKRPSHEARDAMLKVATKFDVRGKKDGQKRKMKDVAESLEARMLSQGKTMLRDLSLIHI